MKTKNETFNIFRQRKVIAANQCNKNKNPRIDNGLEYLAEVFTDYFKEHGIRRHKSVRKTPQQNGLAERMNRTLIERVKCNIVIC